MKLFGKEFNPIRSDIATHIVFFGVPSWAIVLWVQVAASILPALVTCAVLAIVFALFEIAQWLFKFGTGSVTDWFASCFVVFIKGSSLLITYTK
ncbi:hypothetical protein [Psychroserpens algicola]|uniref:hypothetical protein n=1 Tax=Psychroserpens algicola TaxID=1719034 RepID=UPI001954DC8E|nr:hypothetical protein [Psychroserpens algicola]